MHMISGRMELYEEIFFKHPEELENAFEEKAGYDGGLGKVTLSNRPDLCEYRSDGRGEDLPKGSDHDQRSCGQSCRKAVYPGGKTGCAWIYQPQISTENFFRVL